MAELIDKGATLVDMNALLEELEDYIEYDTFDQYKEEPLINMSFETLEDIITSQPTTNEAEIRAEAYDNAYLKLHKLLVDNMFKYGLTPIEIDWICGELEEQLKESE